MSRYIDIEPILEWCSDPEVCEPYGINSVELERKLYDAPSIDIVRCRECKYWDDRRKDAWWSNEGACTITSRLGDVTYRNHDDFCSHGEKN